MGQDTPEPFSSDGDETLRALSSVRRRKRSRVIASDDETACILVVDTQNDSENESDGLGDSLRRARPRRARLDLDAEVPAGSGGMTQCTSSEPGGIQLASLAKSGDAGGKEVTGCTDMAAFEALEADSGSNSIVVGKDKAGYSETEKVPSVEVAAPDIPGDAEADGIAELEAPASGADATATDGRAAAADCAATAAKCTVATASDTVTTARSRGTLAAVKVVEKVCVERGSAARAGSPSGPSDGESERRRILQLRRRRRRRRNVLDSEPESDEATDGAARSCEAVEASAARPRLQPKRQVAGETADGGRNTSVSSESESESQSASVVLMKKQRWRDGSPGGDGSGDVSSQPPAKRRRRLRRAAAAKRSGGSAAASRSRSASLERDGFAEILPPSKPGLVKWEAGGDSDLSEADSLNDFIDNDGGQGDWRNSKEAASLQGLLHGRSRPIEDTVAVVLETLALSLVDHSAMLRYLKDRTVKEHTTRFTNELSGHLESFAQSTVWLENLRDTVNYLPDLFVGDFNGLDDPLCDACRRRRFQVSRVVYLSGEPYDSGRLLVADEMVAPPLPFGEVCCCELDASRVPEDLFIGMQKCEEEAETETETEGLPVPSDEEGVSRPTCGAAAVREIDGDVGSAEDKYESAWERSDAGREGGSGSSGGEGTTAEASPSLGKAGDGRGIGAKASPFEKTLRRARRRSGRPESESDIVVLSASESGSGDNLPEGAAESDTSRATAGQAGAGRAETSVNLKDALRGQRPPSVRGATRQASGGIIVSVPAAILRGDMFRDRSRTPGSDPFWDALRRAMPVKPAPPRSRGAGPTDTAACVRFYMGKDCTRRVTLYHDLVHLKYRFLTRVEDAIGQLPRTQRNAAGVQEAIRADRGLLEWALREWHDIKDRCLQYGVWG